VLVKGHQFTEQVRIAKAILPDGPYIHVLHVDHPDADSFRGFDRLLSHVITRPQRHGYKKFVDDIAEK
jgi:hypothetical protein